MRNVKVRDLKPGDKVDIKDFKGYHDELAEFEYGVVDEVVAETPDCFIVHFENLSSCAMSPCKDVQVEEGIECYQNADYRSIYIGSPIDMPTVGECFLIIFIEDVQECDNVPDSDKWWTALFLVSPTWAGTEAVQAGLDLIGWGDRKPGPVDKAVALAEAGNRIVLWERQTGDWEPDLQEAKREAEKFAADPSLLLPFLTGTSYGKTGYEHLR